MDDLSPGQPPTRRYLHNNMRVMSVAIASDNKTIACGCADGTTWLWDISQSDEDCLHILERKNPNRSRLIWSLAFSPDASIIATGSWENTIDFWDTRTAYSPSGAYMVSGGCDHAVRLWELEEHLSHSKSNDNKIVNTIQDMIVMRPSPPPPSSLDSELRSNNRKESHKIFQPIPTTAQSEEKPRNSIPTDNSKIELAQSAPRLAGLSSEAAHHTSVVRAVTFSSDGSNLATGSWDGTIHIWNTSTGALLKILRGHAELISSIAFLHRSNDELMSTGHTDRTVRLWDLKLEGGLRRTFSGHADSVWMVAVTSKDESAVSCSDDGTLRLWNLPLLSEFQGNDGRADSDSAQVGAGIVLFKFSGEGPIYALCLSPDDRLVAFTSLDIQIPNSGRGYAKLRLLDITSHEILWMGNTIGIGSCLSFSRQGTHLLWGSRRDGSVVLWKVGKGSAQAPTQVIPLANFWAGEAVETISFSADQNRIVSDAGVFDIPSELQPSSRQHQSAPETALSIVRDSEPRYFLLNEWIWQSFPQRRRICWVPMIYRHVRTRDVLYGGTMAAYGNVIAFGTERGRVILVTMADCR
ncbi:hypothetical protein D9757_013444 [Collybiopsis confluens]|uniref:WD40 repeat-like protein n=1 Tax=Collybiopsis confluens TaxID=2823264 RepID=A0A8H5CR65_9AGAR|nr:hypothetical protein D9757_013444 [Collybiopsis confluens]